MNVSQHAAQAARRAIVQTGGVPVEANTGATPQARVRRFLDGALHWVVQADGIVQVHGDRVWLTRSGDADDHVLDGGAVLRVRGGDDLVIEPWRKGGSATLEWMAEGPAAA